MVGEPHITLVASLRVYLYGSESNKVKVPVTWLTPSGTSLTENFYLTKNGASMIRPMNDFYLYPNEPLYIQAKDSDFRLTIRYPKRFV